MLEDVMTIVRSFTTPLKHVIGVNDHWKKHPKLEDFPDMVSNYERGQKMAPKDSAAYILGLQGGEKQKIFCRMVEKTFTKMNYPAHVLEDRAGGSNDEPVVKAGYRAAKGVTLDECDDSPARTEFKEAIAKKAGAYPNLLKKLRAWKTTFDSIPYLDKGYSIARYEDGEPVVDPNRKRVRTQTIPVVIEPTEKEKANIKAKKAKAEKTRMDAAKKKKEAKAKRDLDASMALPCTGVSRERDTSSLLELTYEKGKSAELEKQILQLQTEVSSLKSELRQERESREAAINNVRTGNNSNTSTMMEKAEASGYSKGFAEGKLAVMTALFEKDQGVTLPSPYTRRNPTSASPDSEFGSY